MVSKCRLNTELCKYRPAVHCWQELPSCVRQAGNAGWHREDHSQKEKTSDLDPHKVCDTGIHKHPTPNLRGLTLWLLSSELFIPTQIHGPPLLQSPFPLAEAGRMEQRERDLKSGNYSGLPSTSSGLGLSIFIYKMRNLQQAGPSSKYYSANISPFTFYFLAL